MLLSSTCFFAWLSFANLLRCALTALCASDCWSSNVWASGDCSRRIFMSRTVVACWSSRWAIKSTTLSLQVASWLGQFGLRSLAGPMKLWCLRLFSAKLPGVECSDCLSFFAVKLVVRLNDIAASNCTYTQSGWHETAEGLHIPGSLVAYQANLPVVPIFIIRGFLCPKALWWWQWTMGFDVF